MSFASYAKAIKDWGNDIDFLHEKYIVSSIGSNQAFADFGSPSL
jgi:hypothetical protein